MSSSGGLRVAVLMGGASEERDVSLASGAQVARALGEKGHEVVPMDTSGEVFSWDEVARLVESGVSASPPAPGTPDLLTSGDVGLLTRAPEMEGVDLIFPALHGGAGENGTLQALLDLTGIPYAGSGRLGCTLSMDKEITKRLLRDEGVPTPEWMTDSSGMADVEARLGLPVIVKPPSGGSTLGLTLAHDMAELEGAVTEAARYEDRILFEKYVRGRELTVGILGDEPLPVGEIIPAHEIFDYECKYQPGMAEEIFPADLPAAVAVHLQDLALAVHRLLFLRDFSRVDFLLDEDGTPWCLEANALPGMTANSLLPRAARAADLTFPELCHRIVILATERGNTLRDRAVTG